MTSMIPAYSLFRAFFELEIRDFIFTKKKPKKNLTSRCHSLFRPYWARGSGWERWWEIQPREKPCPTSRAMKKLRLSESLLGYFRSVVKLGYCYLPCNLFFFGCVNYSVIRKTLIFSPYTPALTFLFFSLFFFVSHVLVLYIRDTIARHMCLRGAWLPNPRHRWGVMCRSNYMPRRGLLFDSDGFVWLVWWCGL